MELKTVGPDDYFFRFEYEIGSGWLSPSVIEVFCKCQMPFNPDMFSLMCEACKERLDTSGQGDDFNRCHQIVM
ncbi:hypothetical protein Tco_0941621 [Tanacetum coccineum]|uniref:Uncharacterized protein n=1 Tax=Tanacetum coccineum TaxID=301880 RepID=A0ABQ5DRE7_9ASTR